MGNERALDDVLNDCIERLARGETPEDCLAAHPRHVEELTPLLEVASATLRAATTAYRPEPKTRGLARLNDAISRRPPRRKALFAWPDWRSPVARPVMAGIAIVLVVSGTAMGANALAADSAPGDAFYWLKTGKEQVSLLMPRSDMSKAIQHARLADERTREIGQLMDAGKVVEAERHTAQVRTQLNQTAQLAGLRMSTNPIELPPRALRPDVQRELVDLATRLQRNRLVFAAMLSSYLPSLPSGESKMVVEMMRQNELVYRTIIAVLESGDALVWPPFYRTEPPRSTGR